VIEPKIYQITYDVPDKSTIIQTSEGLKKHNFLKSYFSDQLRKQFRDYIKAHEGKQIQKSAYIVKDYSVLKGIKNIELNYKEILTKELEIQKIKWKGKKHEYRRQKLQQKIDWLNIHFLEIKPIVAYNEIIPLEVI
jgi:hypothetical protein